MAIRDTIPICVARQIAPKEDIIYHPNCIAYIDRIIAVYFSSYKRIRRGATDKNIIYYPNGIAYIHRTIIVGVAA
jgi:hypothetical protein